MQAKPGIRRSLKKLVMILICATFLTGSAGCADTAESVLLTAIAFLGWSALEAANSDDGGDDTPKKVDKGYCENFANLSACYDASPSPDNDYWQSCSRAHAFCCDYAFGGANQEDYQDSCVSVQALDEDFPDLAGHCEACRDFELPDARSVMP